MPLHKGNHEIDLLYRNTLDSIRSAIGPNRYLLGCWGLPLEGMGVMNGSRTGGDGVLSWSGFFTALGPTPFAIRYEIQLFDIWFVDQRATCRSPLPFLAVFATETNQASFWSDVTPPTGRIPNPPPACSCYPHSSSSEASVYYLFRLRYSAAS
jgi:hypothetical protein